MTEYAPQRSVRTAIAIVIILSLPHQLHGAVVGAWRTSPAYSTQPRGGPAQITFIEKAATRAMLMAHHAQSMALATRGHRVP